MNRLLVLGAGRHQTPLIASAVSRGIHTVALDYYTDSPGKRVASEVVLADALDVDAVLAAAIETRVDAITTVGTDQAVLVAATVAAKLGLPFHITPERALAATNKVQMRRALEEAGVQMTDGVVLGPDDPAKLASNVPLPCVVKAADSQGQRGMQRVDGLSLMEQAVHLARAASRTSTVVVERFEAGPELTITTWMRDGEPAFLMAADRHTYNPSPAIGICLRHVAPSVFSHRSAELEAVALGVSRAFGVRDGPLYIQLLATPNGFKVVEAASRVGGGHEAQLFDHMFGLQLIEMSIDLSFGTEVRDAPLCSDGRAGLVNFVIARPGRMNTLTDMNALVRAGRIDEGQWYVNAGFVQGPIVDSMGRVGAFITTGANRADVLAEADEIYRSLSALDGSGNELIFWPDPAALNVPAPGAS